MTKPWMARTSPAMIFGCIVLAGCAQPPLVLGQVDPERVLAPEEVQAGASCTLHKRASLPVSLPGLPVITAEINGKPVTLIVDTGAESSILTAEAARRVGVTTKYDFVRSMSGIGKSVRTGDAKLDSMRLGGVALSFPRVLVGDVSFNLGSAQPDGLLGASLLSDFDLDIDLPHRRIDLYDRLDCAGPRLPWTGRYVTIKTTRSLSQHPFFPMSVNGKTISASLDSGAQRTVISSRAAAGLGIGAESRVAGPELHVRGAAGETLPAALHTVRDLRVGGIPVRGPVHVVPAALPRDIDALLGFDFLLNNRVWLSYGSRRLFIQPN